MVSPYLPEPARSGMSPARSLRSALEVRRAEVEIFHHEIRAAVTLAKEQIDCQASGDATRFCLDTELTLLAYGRARAGSDPGAQALVAGKVVALADRNDRRLTRKYG